MVDAEKFHLSEIVLHVFPARNTFVVCVGHLLHAKLAEAIEVGLNGWLNGEEELESSVCSTAAELVWNNVTSSLDNRTAAFSDLSVLILTTRIPNPPCKYVPCGMNGKKRISDVEHTKERMVKNPLAFC